MKTLLMIFAIISSLQAQAATGHKVLVVLSSSNKITLKDGLVHPTGFFLSELIVPVKGLIEAGYKPVFATPQGNAPTMDKISDSAMWFGGNQQRYQEAKTLLSQLSDLAHPLKLSEVRHLSQYGGIFVPGGHAPMEDLLVSSDLGRILRYFHSRNKPTALICHGPIALLSTLSNPVAFTATLAAGKTPPAQNWIYEGYKMTSFSTKEEQQEEPGQDNALSGFVKFYPDSALKGAGGAVMVADKWQSHVVRDRELITGQNPMSDVALTKAFVQALNDNK